MNITLRISKMKKIIDKQNDLLNLMYKAEKQLLTVAPKYSPSITLEADKLRKEIAEIKTELA